MFGLVMVRSNLTIESQPAEFVKVTCGVLVLVVYVKLSIQIMGVQEEILSFLPCYRVWLLIELIVKSRLTMESQPFAVLNVKRAVLLFEV